MKLNLSVGCKNLLIPAEVADKFVNELNELCAKYAIEKDYSSTKKFEPFILEMRLTD